MLISCMEHTTRQPSLSTVQQGVVSALPLGSTLTGAAEAYGVPDPGETLPETPNETAEAPGESAASEPPLPAESRPLPQRMYPDCQRRCNNPHNAG
jgi:hypothetical protein